MAHSFRLWIEIQRYCVRIPAVLDGCQQGSSYTVIKTVQWHGVCSAV